jgi:hypothetical protein
MGGIFQNRDNYLIPSEVFQEFNYLVDSLIDSATGKICTLVYPQKREECFNCYSSQETGRSIDIYKPGGLESFPNFSICPVCFGEGFKSVSPTEEIRLRVYFSPKDFLATGTTFQVADGIIQVIGYMTDLPKINRAVSIIISSDLQQINKWSYKKEGELIQHGLDGSRYFIGLLRRIS